MKPTVYLETSVIGYLAMRTSRDLIVAANQRMARDWCDNKRQEYELFVSRFVVEECSKGDPAAAKERLVFLQDIALLEVSAESEALSTDLVSGIPLPSKAAVDALHISTAAVNGIQYLLTWNCKHIANATMRSKIEEICRDHGFEPPVICTPQELLEIEDAF